MGAGNAGSGGGEKNNPNYNSAGKLKDKNKIGDNKQSDAQKKSSIEKAQKKEFAKFTKENLNPNNNIQTKTTSTYGGGDGGNNNTINQVTQTAPTVAEVDQVTTDTTPTETAETTEANRLLKIKKKGRSASIISGSQGVTQTSSDYSLGKKSLLGRV